MIIGVALGASDDLHRGRFRRGRRLVLNLSSRAPRVDARGPSLSAEHSNIRAFVNSSAGTEISGDGTDEYAGPLFHWWEGGPG